MGPTSRLLHVTGFVQVNTCGDFVTLLQLAPYQTNGMVSGVFYAALQRWLRLELRLGLVRAWGQQLLLELDKEKGKGCLT